MTTVCLPVPPASLVLSSLPLLCSTVWLMRSRRYPGCDRGRGAGAARAQAERTCGGWRRGHCVSERKTARQSPEPPRFGRAWRSRASTRGRGAAAFNIAGEAAPERNAREGGGSGGTHHRRVHLQSRPRAPVVRPRRAASAAHIQVRKRRAGIIIPPASSARPPRLRSQAPPRAPHCPRRAPLGGRGDERFNPRRRRSRRCRLAVTAARHMRPRGRRMNE
eukprot:scaffold2493_cov285-Prasinococcus_capsulatus_cf.AAC.3